MPDSAPPGQPLLNVATSLTNRTWRHAAPCDRQSHAIAQRHDLPDIIARILANRNITPDTAADFLAPTLRALLPDPSTLMDMQKAATRLAYAIQTTQTVAIFGDYDVDGACSTAILTTFLQHFNVPTLPYIPDRLTEGYGPNQTALQNLAGQGAKLIVCVDCGTSAHDTLATLRNTADVIVLDHHKAESLPPPILATVNPNRLDCTSNLRNLCAAAVTFLTAVATLRTLRKANFFANRKEPNLLSLLDLVALATICDVMPLTGLNRALVAQGLRIMAQRARPGLAALMDLSQKQALTPTAMSCGFGLGPRINAGGRISEADLGLRLLLCQGPLDAKHLAERLDAINRQRQTLEAATLQAATNAADAQMQAGKPVLVVHADPFHPGIVGIVAGRLKEKYNRPTCVSGLSNASAKGSGRSTPSHDLGAAIIAARQSGILTSGGGHAMAAGYALNPNKLADLQAFLCDRLPVPQDPDTRANLLVEAVVSAGGANLTLAQHLARLAPFGAANDEPIIAIPNVRITRTDRIGTDSNTIRATVQSEDNSRLKILLFRAGETRLAQALSDRNAPPIHLAGHLRAETWNGTTTVTFAIVDAALP